MKTGDDEILGLYAEMESAVEKETYQPYRTVLQSVMRRLATRLNFVLAAEDLDILAKSIGVWPPFPDTVKALRKLQEKYSLAIISNVDNDLFDATNLKLEIRFDHIITAQQAEAYKPSQAVFEFAFSQLGVPKDQILHCAQSLYHDIVPGKRLGLKTVWVNRRHAIKGSGATPAAKAKPDFEVPDLESLAELLVPPLP